MRGVARRALVPDPTPGLSKGHSSLSVRLLVARATCYPLSDTDQVLLSKLLEVAV